MQKVVVNKCFGGFALSKAAYEKLIEYGVPVQQYVESQRDSNDGEVIFDRRLDEQDELTSVMSKRQPYWDSWTRETRDHALLVRVVEELGDAASGRLANLKVVEIPDDVEWEIDEYDGNEHIAEKHRTW